MFWQIALLSAQMWLGEVTRKRPQRTKFEDFVHDNAPSEIRPIPYAGGTIELTPTRQWFGDFSQRAVERDSHWTDYIWAGALAFLLDTITVAYRSYIGEMFPLCWGPNTHVERILINERPVFAATPGTDNAGGGFLIDDPQAWGGDQPPGEGGEYAWCDVTRGNYTDLANAYLESLLTTPPNKTPALHGVSTLIKRGPSGFTESGYFHAGGVGVIPKLKEWKVVVRRQPDNLATGFNRIGRHMNPMEVIYEWSTSLEYGAKIPLEELNLDNWRSVAEALYSENNGWSGRIETAGTSPQQVVQDVLAQIDAVAEPSPSLGLTVRPIRRNYSFGSLRILNQSNITKVDRFTPGTYEDTKNKVQTEFPDQNNDFKGRKALYIDPANQLIQGGRVVPQSQSFLGVADFDQANTISTRDGRALALPRAPLECFVFPSWGRLTYRGEVVLFEWESPSFSIVMRVLSITPNGPDEKDYRLVLIEDQFATGLRTFGDGGESLHVDPGGDLDTPPPSATIDSLTLRMVLTNTNEFVPTITGVVTFGAYGAGQYGRIYVTEPGGVQTLSPIRIAPDGSNQATFTWPANAVGEYEFCVQTFSWRGATNGVKVCDTIDVSAIGSPSLSASASTSPSSSVSPSPSSSVSPSPSASQSPSSSTSPSISSSQSPSVSPSASTSPSHSASASQSPSSSISPSASTSPSSSSSPSGPNIPSGMALWLMADAGAYVDAGSTLATNGQTVQQWNDQSGNANHASQATSGNRFTFVTGVLNGLPVLRSVNGKGMLLTSTIGTGAFTIFVVGQYQNQSLFDNGNWILDGNSGSANIGFRWPAGSDENQIMLNNTPSTTTVSPNTFYQIGVKKSSSGSVAVNFRISQADAGSPTVGSTVNGLDRIGIAGTNLKLRGDLAEILFYESALNSTDIGLVETYLNGKWGV